MPKKLKVLVACEFSGAVREAFNAYHGVHAISCDLLPAEDGRHDYHYQGDVKALLNKRWDLMIAFPPCTYLCSSGLHWNKRRPERALLTEQSLDFVRMLWNAPIKHIVMENPVGCISTRIQQPTQKIQPWMFGHPESKKTCLWIKGLPPLQWTEVLPLPTTGHWENQTPSHQNKLGPSDTRWMERSRTYPGIAKAMAAQWVKYLMENS